MPPSLSWDRAYDNPGPNGPGYPGEVEHDAVHYEADCAYTREGTPVRGEDGSASDRGYGRKRGPGRRLERDPLSTLTRPRRVGSR
jgi:hypothetical protein